VEIQARGERITKHVYGFVCYDRLWQLIKHYYFRSVRTSKSYMAYYVKSNRAFPMT